MSFWRRSWHSTRSSSGSLRTCRARTGSCSRPCWGRTWPWRRWTRGWLKRRRMRRWFATSVVVVEKDLLPPYILVVQIQTSNMQVRHARTLDRLRGEYEVTFQKQKSSPPDSFARWWQGLPSAPGSERWTLFWKRGGAHLVKYNHELLFNFCHIIDSSSMKWRETERMPLKVSRSVLMPPNFFVHSMQLPLRITFIPLNQNYPCIYL